MTIGLASDHRGYKAKKFLKDGLYNYDVIDYGTDTEDSVDFPVYAEKLGRALQSGEIDLGIAICGTGIGMSIALNKMKGIYCAKVSNVSEAMLSKSHNDANAIAMSEDLSEEDMLEIVKKFIETPFSNVNKYVRRNEMIKEIENG
ncbi:MAG: RpiB/LacA/LacB family sugar-phosphate isomerase [Bacilli bacterium]